MNAPNILILICDQLNASVLGCYGGPVPTPNIDRLAEAGARFTDAVCPTPFCSPSRASMILGLYPHTHGVTDEFLALNEEVPTLSVMLKRQGYWNAAFATMPHLSPRHGFGRGFDAYICKEVSAPVACEQTLKWLSQVGSRLSSREAMATIMSNWKWELWGMSS